MIVSKPGNGCIVRLPDDVAERLRPRENDAASVEGAEYARPVVTDPARRRKILDELQRFRGMMPPGFKFDRDRANER